MSNIPSTPTIVTFAIIILGSIFAYKSNAEGYFYTEVSLGHWVDGNAKGLEPDGELPIVFNFGKAWETDNIDSFIEVRHRSNLDLGWPVTKAGANEYSRNGVFIGFKYKFRK